MIIKSTTHLNSIDRRNKKKKNDLMLGIGFKSVLERPSTTERLDTILKRSKIKANKTL